MRRGSQTYEKYTILLLNNLFKIFGFHSYKKKTNQGDQTKKGAGAECMDRGLVQREDLPK